MYWQLTKVEQSLLIIFVSFLSSFPHSAIDPFSYVLDVTGMFPSSGSLQGGTEVTLTGAGFGTDPDNITVSMGGFGCEVTDIADDELTCMTAGSSVDHQVDNMGKHNSKCSPSEQVVGRVAEGR